MIKGRRVLSLVMALLMVFALAPAEGGSGLVPVAKAVTQSEIDSLKSESKELANQLSGLKGDLADLRTKQDTAVKQKNLIDQQISLTVQKIDNTEKQIAGFQTLLVQSEYELEQNRLEEERQFAVFCERARVMEEAGTTTYWSVLFKADSFSDLLSRLSDVQEVVNYDQSLLDNLHYLRAQIQAKQEEQELLMAESEAAKLELEEQKADLDKQHIEAQRLLDEISANVKKYEAELAAMNAERNRIESEIAKKTEEMARQYALTATKGGYIWPESVSNKITSPMGKRNTGIKGASTNHKGVDIGGVGTSTKVVATKAGVVQTSAYSSSYGNYVVIYHGPGNTTLYAHMSSRSVKEGDSVTQGQAIGVTGSTGISSGAHLHYEIVEGGARVNPLNYLPGYVMA